MNESQLQSQTPSLSDRAKQLIPKARIVSFAEWNGVADSAIA